MVLSVNASHAQRVRFVLTPTGTETGPYGRLLGEDRDPSDGFRLAWRYPSQGLSAHLGIQAIGPWRHRRLDARHRPPRTLSLRPLWTIHNPPGP